MSQLTKIEVCSAPTAIKSFYTIDIAKEWHGDYSRETMGSLSTNKSVPRKFFLVMNHRRRTQTVRSQNALLLRLQARSMRHTELMQICVGFEQVSS